MFSTGELVVITIPGTLLVATVLSGLTSSRIGRAVTLLASLIVLLVSSWYAFAIEKHPLEHYMVAEEFILDPLAAWLLLAISITGFASALHSWGYIDRELEHGRLTENDCRLYYALFNIFMLTMVLSAMFNNIFLIWVAIEATTLASAFLVGIYGSRESLEAAWKYVILCSLGLVFSLYGTSILYSNAVGITGSWSKATLWSSLVVEAGSLSPGLLKLAFITLLIGYGTKAGLAPLHTWLPDAHAEAPAPISSLLSGVLVKCAIIALARFTALMFAANLGSFASPILLALGLLSLWIGALVILVSKDVKRMLAFSTIENIGLIATGLALGSLVATKGAILHVLSHGMAKSSLFLMSGLLMLIYGTRDMSRMRDLYNTHKILAVMLLLGGIATAGLPPFLVFISELSIIMGSVDSGALIVFLILGGLAVGFAGLLRHLFRIIFLTEEHHHGTRGKRESINLPLSSLAAVMFLIILLLLLGIFMPSNLSMLLNYASSEVVGNV